MSGTAECEGPQVEHRTPPRGLQGGQLVPSASGCPSTGEVRWHASTLRLMRDMGHPVRRTEVRRWWQPARRAPARALSAARGILHRRFADASDRSRRRGIGRGDRTSRRERPTVEGTSLNPMFRQDPRVWYRTARFGIEPSLRSAGSWRLLNREAVDMAARCVASGGRAPVRRSEPRPRVLDLVAVTALTRIGSPSRSSASLGSKHRWCPRTVRGPVRAFRWRRRWSGLGGARVPSALDRCRDRR